MLKAAFRQLFFVKEKKKLKDLSGKILIQAQRLSYNGWL
jgi:hypothetical protein